MSRKQQIYCEMLRHGLPFISSFIMRCQGNHELQLVLQLEAELLHNLPSSLLEPAFVENDIWFLNYQGRAFLQRADPQNTPNYRKYEQLIRELFEIVPGSLRGGLMWAGPER